MANQPHPTASALVIDQIEANRRLLRRNLETLNYAVEESDGGLDAIRRIDSGTYDAVFLDWTLADGLRGEHIARHLRSCPSGDRVLLIAVTPRTSVASPGDADACITLPSDAERVRTSLAEARRLRAPQSPAATRVLRALQAYSEVFPGGMQGALRHCRDEILAEQKRMREAAVEGRWHEAARAAHNLGSIGAMTGLPLLHTTARAAETALRASDSAAISPALEATHLAIETARATLTGLIE